jgi:hypothetical protein
MSESSKKPTYQELWHDQGAFLVDIWEGGTKLDANTLSVIWNHFPTSKENAELALQEYNGIFRTHYTLDQVDIPIIEG